MKNRTSANTTMEVASQRPDASQLGLEVSKTGVGVVWGLGALIGLWGIACFIGGLVEAGGPVELAKSWLAAVTGM